MSLTDKIIALMYDGVMDYEETRVDPASYIQRCIKCHAERFGQHHSECPNQVIEDWLNANSTQIDKATE